MKKRGLLPPAGPSAAGINPMYNSPGRLQISNNYHQIGPYEQSNETMQSYQLQTSDRFQGGASYKVPLIAPHKLRVMHSSQTNLSQVDEKPLELNNPQTEEQLQILQQQIRAADIELEKSQQ